VHDDGSETAIKTTPLEKFGGVYGKVSNKYNVFISISVGCIVGCRFCYLTTKNCPYIPLTKDDIVTNVVEAMRSEVQAKPELRGMYTKLSWMGMGDVYMDIEKMYKATIEIACILEQEKLSAGIDGVDISTTLPKVPAKGEDYISALAHSIKGFKLNPERHYYELGTRHPIRVFYSLHSAFDDNRRFLIPKTISLPIATKYLKSLVDQDDVTLVIHHMFFSNLNDDDREVEELLTFLKAFEDVELRLLRFNQCEGTLFRESLDFNSIVDNIYSSHKNIKVQSSPGAEVASACGQFLLSNIKST
jgi:adenine C2-methylase RlmN of 23S rRNA A2503 and tRNA A37